jgi:hypothetical protein
MWLHRPAEIDLIDEIGQERMRPAAAAETAKARPADGDPVKVVVPIGVFRLEPPRALLVTDPRPGRETGIETCGRARQAGSLDFLVLQQRPSAFATEIERLRPRRRDRQNNGCHKQ